MSTRDLPTLNAVLNGVCALLLLAGYAMIRQGRIAAHRALMISAFAVSTAFLASYVAYHYQVGSVRFAGVGWIRVTYLAILFSHIVLAAVTPVLAIVTLTRALRGQIEQHRRIARWTLPIWLYVSLTGVIVYWMLYRLGLPGA